MRAGEAPPERRRAAQAEDLDAGSRRDSRGGSWEGVPPDVTIINWNHGRAKESLLFFGGPGHSQILAGYYDSAPARIRDWQAQAEPADRVIGVMYTTWRKNYVRR